MGATFSDVFVVDTVARRVPWKSTQPEIEMLFSELLTTKVDPESKDKLPRKRDQITGCQIKKVNREVTEGQRAERDEK